MLISKRPSKTYVFFVRPNILHTNRGDDQHLYRWMFNHTRTKHGQGLSSNVNLTAGPPKKKAPVQTYVKHYWNSKVKQEVIDRWAPTPETDLFDEADIGEDQVPWEELDPMEKDIPLWFRMKVGRELYEAESEEVKAEIDRIREQEKEDAIAARALSLTFTTEEERLHVMSRFDEYVSCPLGFPADKTSPHLLHFKEFSKAGTFHEKPVCQPPARLRVARFNHCRWPARSR